MLPPWRSLLSTAIHHNRSKTYSHYFQLATVTPEGYPRNRTLVFRGFVEDASSSLKMITDLRSGKIQDIEKQAMGEICWYFTKTREQFRIQGNLRLVTAQEKDLDALSLLFSEAPEKASLARFFGDFFLDIEVKLADIGVMYEHTGVQGEQGDRHPVFYYPVQIRSPLPRSLTPCQTGAAGQLDRGVRLWVCSGEGHSIHISCAISCSSRSLRSSSSRSCSP